ncbi:sensor histidine kinase [Maribellus sp. YY47]|uniref:sensor histidine kinase n=1 Tax=Maribellus sp. YY47 TaxID=2929486 RepID=UPI00200112AB|nr:sensor histidine kinase [Maribellus sp. YY47]MCK3685830.1 sensor histidine kinase [Maribellus sp. YY47]
MDRKILQSYFKIYIPIFILFSGVAFTLKKVRDNSDKLISLNEELTEINTKSRIINRDLNFIIGDLQILAALNIFHELWLTPDNSKLRNDITTIFSKISRERQLYDQIRLIDNNGMEIIRVNLQDSIPVVVPFPDLQNKKHRPYFTNTIRLNKGEIYVSPFDLNTENKKIEVPLKPILRFATPMFNEKGEKEGILILNYLGSFMLKNSVSMGNYHFSDHFMLLNKDSYWLKSSDPELEWGFMFSEKHQVKFQNDYPEEWKIIQTEQSGQFENEKGLFTFNTIYPPKINASSVIRTDDETSNAIESYYWKAVSFVPHAELYKSQRARNLQLLLVYLLLNLMAGFGSWVLARAINKRKLVEEKMRKNLIKLQELNATKDRFFSIIAHDLRSPFNTMLGFGEMLKEEVDAGNTQNIKEYTRILFLDIQKTYNLLTELLDWANLQLKKFSFSPRLLNIEQCVTETFQILELSALNKKLTLEKSVPEDLKLKADRNMFCTIVRNLLANAIKFTPEGGHIRFTAEKSNDQYLFSVADNGIGIRTHNLKKLFKLEESFTTPGTNQEKGTGLGLILCKELVEKHGGQIWAESEPGHGAKFHFTIPIL